MLRPVAIAAGGTGGHLFPAEALASALAARGQRFDVIFLDPPYQLGLLTQILPLCPAILNEGGLVYAETGEALPLEAELPEWLQGWDAIRADKAGMVYYYLLKLNQPDT